MDQKLRELERQTAQGDRDAQRRLMRERVRLGQDVLLVETVKPLMSHTWTRLANAILRSRVMIRDERGRPQAWGRIDSADVATLTIRDLLHLIPEELLEQPNCGPVTVARAASVLVELGVPLTEPWDHHLQATEQTRRASAPTATI